MYGLDSTAGERIWAEIDQMRQTNDKKLLVASVASLRRDGVLKEIEKQVDENPEKILVISRDHRWTAPRFPVSRAQRDLKPFLMDKNYVDFGKLCYPAGLRKLVKGLKRPSASSGKGGSARFPDQT